MIYKVRVDRDFSRLDGYCVWLMAYDTHSKKTFKSKPIKIEWEEHQYYLLSEPTIQLSELDGGPDILRALAEGIIQGGIAPMLSIDSEKQVDALKDNLKDLRGITNKLLDIEQLKINSPSDV